MQNGVAPIFDYEGTRRVLFQPERPVFSLGGPYPMTGDDAQARELTNQVLMQIRDNLDLIRRKQESFGDDLHAVSERVVRLEERNERLNRAERAIENIDGKVAVLLKDKDQRDGAISAWSWLAKHWPTATIGAALAALIAWANGKLG